MGILSVDTANPDLFKSPSYKVIPSGRYTFEVANDLTVEDCKNSENRIMKIELRCLDDGDAKGAVVFDNIVFMTDTSSEKAQKAMKINQARLCQFAVGCGIATQEEIEATGNIDTGTAKGRVCECLIGIRNSKNPNTGEDQQQNVVKQYLFEPSENK